LPNDRAQLTGNTEWSEAKQRIDWSDAAYCYAFLLLS